MSNWNAHLILPNKSINNDKNQNEIELKILGGNDHSLEKINFPYRAQILNFRKLKCKFYGN